MPKELSQRCILFVLHIFFYNEKNYEKITDYSRSHLKVKQKF